MWKLWDYLFKVDAPKPPEGYFMIYFKPQRDITAFELATFVSHFESGIYARYFGVYVTPKQWEEFGDQKRHWTLDKPE